MLVLLLQVSPLVQLIVTGVGSLFYLHHIFHPCLTPLQATYFNYYSEFRKALEHFLECGKWQKAHTIFMTSVAHSLFLSGIDLLISRFIFMSCRSFRFIFISCYFIIQHMYLKTYLFNICL